MMLRYLNRLAHYNAWANTALARYLEQASEEVLMTHVQSSFPSIYRTVLHIRGAEKVWFDRLQGHSPSDFEITPAMRGRGVFAGLLDQSRALQQYVTNLTGTTITEEVEYRLFNGTPMRNSRAEMLQHCFNHSTYHRGQLVMFGRQLDLGTPPATDLIRFYREHPEA